MNDVIYKIKRKTDGLYSLGGRCNWFSKIGKVWRHKGHLRNHLNQSLSMYNNLDDYEIVTFETIMVNVEPLHDEMAEIVLNKTKKKEASMKRESEYAKKRAIDELNRLKKYYPELFDETK